MDLGELISKLLPITEQLISPGGVEGKLAQERFRKRIGLIFVAAGAVLQFIISVISGNVDSIRRLPYYLINFKDFLCLVLTRKWDLAANYEIAVELSGIVVLFAGFFVWVFFFARSVYRQYSEEPFKYTFWVEPFKHVEDTEKEKIKIEPQDRFHYLLHHDLAERLNDRIRRLFILNPKELDDSAKKNLSSHIHIEGHYVIREKKDGEWVIHVMPCVRIGSPANPATLSTPVPFKIDKDEIYGIESKLVDIGSNKYNQIVERVYSSVATEIYKQIEFDLKEKIELFPTRYLRAVALYNEAKDFARSNTIDAYDRAIELYEEALQYFNISEIKIISKLFLKLPLLWRLEVKFQHTKARVQIGYAECLIYRRELSALSGRYKNPLFKIRGELNEVTNKLRVLHNKINTKKWKMENIEEREENNKNDRLKTIMAFLTFPRDTWVRKYLLLRSSQNLFKKQRLLLFDSYVVAALTHSSLGAIKKAEDYLKDAKAVDPTMSERNALYLFASGVIEPNIDNAISFFRQATEFAPNFQIAQYLLAYHLEKRFRIQNEITEERAKRVLDEYDTVLRINPGNIAVLSAQGYIWWLLYEKSEKAKEEFLKKVKEKFEEGCEVKAISQQTFIGQLNYGLARIAAEEGDFNVAYLKFTEAIEADPGVGVYSATASGKINTPYYDYIDTIMLKRYDSFNDAVESKIKEAEEGKLKDKNNKKFSQKTLFVVHSFVLNDYANACLNYFHRFGDMGKLEKAINAYRQAIDKYPENFIAYYNLQNAYVWRGREEDKKVAIDCIKKATDLAPTWPVAVVALAQSVLQQSEFFEKMQEAHKEIKKAEEYKKDLKKERDKLIYDRARASEKERSAIPQNTLTKTYPDGTITSDILKKISDLNGKILESEKKANKLFQEAREKSEKCLKEVSNKVNRIFEKTKLSSVFEGFEFNINGQGVDDLLLSKKEIERDRLDESDVEALRVWADILSYNFLDEFSDKAQDAAQRILEYIQVYYYPDNYDLNMILWRRALNRKQYDQQGIERYTEIIKSVIKNWLDQDPNHYVSLLWAKDFFKEDEYIPFFQKANNNAVVQNLLGNIYFNRSDYQESVPYYKKAVELDAQVAVYYANLGGAYRELKQLAVAEESYLEAIKLEPKNAQYHNNLGNMYWEIPNWGKAIKEYTEAFELDNQPIYLCNLGRAHGNSGQWYKMIEYCSKAVELRRVTPTDTFGLDYYYELLAEGYSKDKRLNEFIKLFERSDDLKDEPKKKAIIYNRIGNLLVQGGQVIESIPYYEKAISLDDKWPIYECNLGLSYGKLPKPDWDKMIEHCSKAVELRRDTPTDPYGLDYYYEFLAEGYFRSGRLAEFEKLFEESGDFENEQDKKAKIYNRIGNLFFEAFKNQEAKSYYEKAIGLATNIAVYHGNLGLAFKALKQWDDAEAAFKRAASLEPNNATYQNDLGNVYFERGNYEKAIPYYEKAIEFDPNVAVYHANLGGSFRALGQWDEAIKKYELAIEKATKTNPNDKTFHKYLSLIYNDRGVEHYNKQEDYKAIEDYKKAIELNDHDPVIYHNLYLAYFAKGMYKEAKEAINKALALSPDNQTFSQALNTLMSKGI